jgi:outer membrane protein assembly factor BamB
MLSGGFMSLSRLAAALGAALLLGLTSVSAAPVSTWSMAGHDAQNTAFNNTEFALGAQNVARLHPVWTARGVLNAIATDQRVYAIVSNGVAPPRVVVMNAADGKVLLAYTPAMLHLTRFTDDIPQALAHPDDTLVVASTRAVVALNPHNGKLRWYSPGGATSLVVNGSTVYTGKVCRRVCGPLATYALDLRTGRRIWQHPGNLAGAPTVVNGGLYVPIDASTGSTRVYSQKTASFLGTLRISADWLGDVRSAYAFALMNARSNGTVARRAWIGQISSSGTVVWKADLGKVASGNPVLAYGDVFVPSNRHHPGVIGLNARTGAFLWGADIGASSNMLVANHLLYVLHSTTGTVDVLRTANGTLVRRLTIAGFSRRGGTGLMVAGGTLYARSTNGLVALRP